MIGEAMRVGMVVSGVIGVGMTSACSGADAGATNVQGFSALALQVESPTGTLDAATVRPVVEEFEKAWASGTDAGMWRLASTDDENHDTCVSGGSSRTSGEGDAQSGELRVSYNGCCLEGGCCLNGIWHIAHDEGSSGASPYSVCTNYDVSSTCDVGIETVDYVSCTDSGGQTVYSVQVEGKRFSVSGAHDHENGALTITDANETWSCTYSAGAGLCTGTNSTITF